MPIGWHILYCFLVPFLITLLLTPQAMVLAPLVGAVDIPRDGRRMHHHPIPRLGGVAIFLAFLTVMLLPGIREPFLYRFLWGSTLLVLIGILDDVYRLSAWLKLGIQVVAVSPAATYFGAAEHYGPRWLPLIFLYLLALTNAHNLIDGLDGLAAGISAAEAGALLLLALLGGDPSAAFPAAGLAGCAIGFLPYNRHPARIFMGDTGSLFFGFALAATSLEAGIPRIGALGWLLLPLVFALPFSDMFFAIIRRLTHGKTPFTPDRGHWHHRLVDAGLSQKRAAGWLVIIAALLDGVAVLLSREIWYPAAAYLTLLVVGLVWLLDYRMYRRRNGGTG